MDTFLAWLFPWRTIRNNGAWLYQEHARNGSRRALRIPGSGYQPIDALWLRRMTSPTTPPPMPRKV